MLQDGRTALHEAAYGNQMDVVRVLLEHGADITLQTNVSSEGREGRGGEGEGCGADVQMSERLIRCRVFACVVIDMYDRMA